LSPLQQQPLQHALIPENIENDNIFVKRYSSATNTKKDMAESRRLSSSSTSSSTSSSSSNDKKKSKKIASSNQGKIKDTSMFDIFLYCLMSLTVLFFGLLFAIPSYGGFIAQQYIGIDNYSYTASIMRNLAISKSSRNADLIYYMGGVKIVGDSKYDTGIRGKNSEEFQEEDRNSKSNLIRQKIGEELFLLQGCGDRLFPLASTYEMTEKMMEVLNTSKRCPNQDKSNFLHSKDIKNEKLIDDNDKENNETRNIIESEIFYNDLLTHSNGYEKILPKKYNFTSKILQPLDGLATLSSTLMWEFDGIFLQGLSVFNQKFNFLNQNISEELKISLDVRVDNKVISFPGGNSIDVLVKENKPVSFD
jgi:hypothetical protein